MAAMAPRLSIAFSTSSGRPMSCTCTSTSSMPSASKSGASRSRRRVPSSFTLASRSITGMPSSGITSLMRSPILPRRFSWISSVVKRPSVPTRSFTKMPASFTRIA